MRLRRGHQGVCWKREKVWLLWGRKEGWCLENEYHSSLIRRRAEVARRAQHSTKSEQLWNHQLMRMLTSFPSRLRKRRKKFLVPKWSRQRASEEKEDINGFPATRFVEMFCVTTCLAVIDWHFIWGWFIPGFHILISYWVTQSLESHLNRMS